MEPNTEGNLLEVMDLARTLRQEQLFIQQEQAKFVQLTETLSENSTSITKLAYICAQQRHNLNGLVISRPENEPIVCCRNASNYENANFVDAKKVMEYEHTIAYEKLFSYLYKSPYILALSLATGDRLTVISPQLMSSTIHTVSTGIYGNAINSKDVEMILKLLRELIEIQIVVSDNPQRLLRANSSAFARLYHRLNESMFSAKIFLTAALFEPIMDVLSVSDTILDVNPHKVVQSFNSKERFRRFGIDTAPEYQQNVDKFHRETITKLHSIVVTFIDSLTRNWSVFPSTLRWLVQTMCHQLKQTSFSEQIINEIITDMVFTHFICPVIVNPDIIGIIDAPISEQVRYNLIQIGQIIKTLALGKHGTFDVKFAKLHAKFNTNSVANLIDMLLVSQSGEDVVAILSQQSDFERNHLLSTQSELTHFVEFFRILMMTDEYDVSMDERQKLRKILEHLPQTPNNEIGASPPCTGDAQAKERSKQSFISLGKSTRSKLAKSISFSTNNAVAVEASSNSLQHANGLPNHSQISTGQVPFSASLATENKQTPNGAGYTPSSSINSSPLRSFPITSCENEPILVFNIYIGEEHKLQPLTEEEVLKMNSIGQEITNGEPLLDTGGESVNLENTIDKSSVVNCFNGMSDVHRPLHTKTKRFSMSHDDASVGNSDNLEAVSEAPSNHSVTSSLELEENDQNDNLSDMVSANVSGRGSPNISGRDTPSSQVTDGDSVHNALPTPQMQKLISKARSDIEDKFCKFELKKFEGDETVSIISDTWSTDVLASDSETLDASERERERDRNFSTPLIPSAVVLPGDNNFSAMNGPRGCSIARSNYMDAFDQRSESNWSTDVLASDSEKLAEVDTDDNLSITAKSDTTDAGVRSEQERDLLAAAISAPNPEKQQHYGSHTGRNFRAADRNTGGGGSSLNTMGVVCGEQVHGSHASSGGNASDHSQEDSAFFDAINLYEEAAAAAAASAESTAAGNDLLASAATLHHYHGLSSLARSSVPTTNQYSGENSFQQNYKSGSNDCSKETFLATSHLRRQTSAESSISNQSLNLDEAIEPEEKPHKIFHKGLIKKKKHGTSIASEPKDLIDFSDFGVEERKPVVKELVVMSPQFNKPLSSIPLLNIFGGSDDSVEHRRSSIEQRSTVFDGRRNGIIAMKGDATASQCRQTLNYENHVLPNFQEKFSQTDDDKSQQETILCAKTELLHLTDDNENNNNVCDGNIITLDSPHATPKASMIITAASNTSISCQKPTKYTGAIPKSISFDASADKSSNANTSISTRVYQNQLALHDAPLRHSRSANSSIFNKLKHGLFKNRRGKSSHRHTFVETPATNDELASQYRNVSFGVTNGNKMIFDMHHFTGGNDGVSVPYADISEDILAKYRRKVSTSSEATNSDSTGGNNVLGKCKISDAEPKLPSALLHDKNFAFNIIKRKLRTVLSKTNLHTADFRHTTYSNISPLLTYLQIQLAQALNLRNFQQIAYVSEAIRCIDTLQPNQHAQLLEELQTDIQKRQNYLQYLMRYRQHLLLIMENVQQFETRLRSESTTCNRHIMAVCVRLFIEKREPKIVAFQEEFACLNVSDDKIDLIEEFIESLVVEFSETAAVSYVMPEWQASEARTSIERIVLYRMYQQVMFPNDDADVSRDTVLSEHISKLQAVIRPSHPALRIPVEYLSESPWFIAQQQLFYISAYKTPREKLQCVIRCITSIMNLLNMSSGRVPSADDLLPVLIFVVIMTNPPYLLSTIEYISCFIGEKLDGEEQFHWTLFGSVVKFIKTMDYLE